jgi:tetratricopeptide (TPR) repeat protein
LRDLIRHTDDNFSQSIQQLTARRIITGDRILSFRHDLIREGVYRRIPTVRRRLLHRRVAMLFKANGESFSAVARHFYLAGEYEPAHEHAKLAVAAADARLALNEAAQFVKLALRTAPNRVIRARLHHDLAQRSFRLRHYRDALHHIDAALDQRVGMKAEDKAALTLLQLEMLITIGRISTHELTAHLTEFERMYSPSLNNDLRYGVLRLLIRSSAIEGDTTRCSDYARDLVNYAANWGGVLSAQALGLAARIRSYTTSYIEALPWAEHAERMLAADVSPEIAADVLTNVGSVYSDAGEYDRALRLYNDALGLIQASGALHIWPRTATHKHMLLVEMGLFGDARAIAADISAAWNEDDAHQHISTLEGNIALMYYHLQDYEQSLIHANNSLSTGGNLRLYSHRLTATALIGIAHLEAGRLSAANKSAADLLDQIGPFPKRLGDYSFVEIFLTRWHVRCGRLKEATDSLEAALKDCVNRDVGSYLRMKVEYARLLRRSNPALAATLAKEANEAAVRIGARPTADQSELLVGRIRG